MKRFQLLGSILLSLFLVTGCASKKSKSKKGNATAEAPASKKKDGIQPYNKVITKDAKSDPGLFTVHKVEDTYFYEIPDSLFNREMLMVTRIAKTATGLGFGGGKQNTQNLRWERKNKDVLLRVVSNEIVAADSLPVSMAVANSNFEPILYSFPIKAVKKDSLTNNVVIDVTDFFSKDVPAIGLPQRSRSSYKISRLDDSRSYIDTLRSYPMNIESRHVKTYSATDPPNDDSVQSFSIEMSNSMILLPKIPMKRRYFDQRVGWFARGQQDYGLDAQYTKTITYLDRWRLEVKDEDLEKFKNGELVLPKKQIVYYIDPATPVQWRKYIKQGIEDWQIAFEAAGFKEAIIAKDAPTKAEDPDWSPEDVRYSVVRYLASPIPNANGPHVSDPRSGEILESDINWYHNVMTLLRNWFFVQTAAINPDARSIEFKEEVMGRLIRFVSSHEVGHTIGLPHNMGSSIAYSVENLRSPAFTKEFGTAPSIMDYARFNYVAQPGDGDVALMPNIGPYDKYSVAWGYKPILDKTAEDEKPVLDAWILEKAGDPIYRFGRQQGNVVDHTSQTEDLGDDSMRASTLGIANLKRIIPNLITWTGKVGEDYDELQNMYGEILGQYNRYMGHVTGNIGGVKETYKAYGQEGAVYEHASKDKQSRAMKFLQEELFTTPEWLIENDIFNKVESDGAIERIRGTQVRALNNVLDFGRMARLMENEEVNGTAAYGLYQMMKELRSGIFSELPRGQKTDRYRRNLQRAYVERLEFIMNNEQRAIPAAFRAFAGQSNVDVAQSDIRPIVRAELNQLQRDARNASGKSSDALMRIHLQDLVERIEAILNPKS
jgi:hypothetical protein